VNVAYFGTFRMACSCVWRTSNLFHCCCEAPGWISSKYSRVCWIL